MVVAPGVEEPSVKVVGLPSHALEKVKLAVGSAFTVTVVEYVLTHPFELVIVRVTTNEPTVVNE